MFRIVKIALFLVLFGTIILPLIDQFGDNFAIGTITSSATTAISSMINYTSSYFQNVRGLINYVISYSFGSSAITAYNLLLKISLLLPIFGLSARLIIGIRRYFFL